MHPIMTSVKLLILLLILVFNPANANNDAIRVVTSFSILEDLVHKLGGEHVNVVNLVGRDIDAHMYQPKPSDAVAIASAELVIFNGLEFEGWMSRLLQNSQYQSLQLIASKGAKVIKNGNEIDPHAWQSFSNIRVYINNITDILVMLRPQYAAIFNQNKQQYLQQLDKIEQNLKQKINRIPKQQRVVVTSHDAFGYLGQELDIRFLAPQGFSIEVEASAEDVAAIIDQIRSEQVKALFVENINNPRLLKRIAAEAKVAIGGRLYSDALSQKGESADTYLNMMQHNINLLINAFNAHLPD